MARVNEGVEIRYLTPEQRETELAKLINPWIGDEGPLDAGFRRGLGDGPLRARGVAFDDRTTVVWDEAGVQVLQAGEAKGEIVALCSPVLLHNRFKEKGPSLCRIDYLCRGALLGSRFTAEGENDA
ncbi:MAG TPA: hypothetical protein VIA62_27140 [Thermoanaerobaculia bacterium]|jgi:hypothetical protein|nr:hypothetical protein [Thermoanaerobaculia bacterium]